MVSFSHFQKFMHSYGNRQPKLKVLSSVETSRDWFRPDEIHMRLEYGVSYVKGVLTTLRTSVDKGRLVSVSSSMELDMQ